MADFKNKKLIYLNPRQRTFCKYYLMGLSCTQAAEKAGYKRAKFKGRVVLQSPHVQEFLRRAASKLNKKLERKLAKEEKLTRKNSIKKEADEFVEDLVTSLANIDDDKELGYDLGIPLPTYEYKIRKLHGIVEIAYPDGVKTISEIDYKAAIEAIKELNKMQGHYSPEKYVGVSLHVDTDLQNIQSTLEEIIKKNQKEY